MSSTIKYTVSTNTDQISRATWSWNWFLEYVAVNASEFNKARFSIWVFGNRKGLNKYFQTVRYGIMMTKTIACPPNQHYTETKAIATLYNTE